MISRQNNSHIRKFILFGGIVFLFFLFQGPFGDGVKGALGAIARPFFFVSEKTSTFFHNVGLAMENKDDLRERVRLMEDEIALLKLERASVGARIAEYERIASTTLSVPEGITARVITRPRLSPYDTIVLDMGENAGVQKGDLVLAGGHIAIGTIALLSDTTSLVLLFSKDERETPALVGATPIAGTALGKGNGNLLMEFPKDTSIAVNDSVILDGAGTFVLGEIKAIEQDPNKPIMEALIISPININTLRTVSVIPYATNSF